LEAENDKSAAAAAEFAGEKQQMIDAEKSAIRIVILTI